MQKATNLAKGHVRFGLNASETRDNSILIQESGPDCISVNLGFLQFQHHYSITLDIPKAYFPGYAASAIIAAAERNNPNINCRITVFEENIDSFHATIELYARKEKLLKEEICFKFDDKTVKFVFIARVLGEGKGTPLLKNEVKCIGTEVENEMSESSDWTDFD